MVHALGVDELLTRQQSGRRLDDAASKPEAEFVGLENASNRRNVDIVWRADSSDAGLIEDAPFNLIQLGIHIRHILKSD
jgi:hypothetical protein